MAMVCGPEVMMRFAVMELHKRGVPADRIYVSMERNMKCGIGLCGHCQFGPQFVCKDGPIFRFDRIETIIRKAGDLRWPASASPSSRSGNSLPATAAS